MIAGPTSPVCQEERQTARVSVARGDGIGPEIMEAVLEILEHAAVKLSYDLVVMGEKAFLDGAPSGITPESWDTLRRNRVLLKAPITTPQGGGYKSLNVTIRKTLGLYANVRPCAAYHPFVRTRFPGMDLVIVRENEEDLYAGIEHRQTQEVTQCLKLISRPGSEKIVRHAFELARQHRRRKVTCFSKDNIMKVTDGLFHKTFDRVAAEYPEIETEHWIIDIATALVADNPERFDVVVMPNLYGDIVSDVAAQVSGSVGLGGSANVGDTCAMFEAIHGSAPGIAGKNVANPSGLLLAAVMMLVHLDLPEEAARVHNAWLKTLEDGVGTPDIHGTSYSDPVGTREFADAVVARLGEGPTTLAPVRYAARQATGRMTLSDMPTQEKRLVGVDVFLDWDESGRDPQVLGARLAPLAGDAFELQAIANRGVVVYPGDYPETFCVDHWGCRFVAAGAAVTHAEVLALLGRIGAAGLDFVKTEHLHTFDGQRGWSLSQGQ